MHFSCLSAQHKAGLSTVHDWIGAESAKSDPHTQTSTNKRSCHDDNKRAVIKLSCEKLAFQRLGGGGCNKFVPVLGGDGTKTAPPGNLFDQPLGEMK